MSHAVYWHSFNSIRKTHFALALACAVTVATSADADIVTVDNMVLGITTTAAQCATKPEAVWISAKGRNFCMRYYLASSGEARKPIIFLQGDRLGVLNLRTGKFALPPGEKDINTDDLMRAAVSLSRQAKTTAIYLARVGVEGSSGDHRMRHSVLELHATNAALDAVKQKHNFEGFHLLGQSGGAHLVAGLLGLRNDVGCAVIGSGPLNPNKRLRLSGDPALEHFNPTDILAAIVRNRTPRIMVVTDPADRKVNADSQTGFVRMLQQAGRPVEQYMVQAIDENRHGVVMYSRVALSGCLRGAKSEEIAQDVNKLIQRAAAIKGTSEGRADSGKGSAASGQSHGHTTTTETPQRAHEPATPPVEITHGQ